MPIFRYVCVGFGPLPELRSPKFHWIGGRNVYDIFPKVNVPEKLIVLHDVPWCAAEITSVPKSPGHPESTGQGCTIIVSDVEVFVHVPCVTVSEYVPAA